MSSNRELERAIAAPEAVFRHPREVLALQGCPVEDKIAILLSWQRTLIQLQTASEENMLPEEEPGRSSVTEPLAEVTKALTELGHSSEACGSMPLR